MYIACYSIHMLDLCSISLCLNIRIRVANILIWLNRTLSWKTLTFSIVVLYCLYCYSAALSCGQQNYCLLFKLNKQNKPVLNLQSLLSLLVYMDAR